jgi:uncharacterized membrane protein
MAPLPALETLADRIEQADGLDGIAAKVQELISRVLPPPAEDLLRGEPLGHPLHPALVALPIGAWTSASVLDLLGERSAASKLTALGCLTALPTAAAGAADWATTTGAARRTGFVHAAVNDAALMTYLLSWRARRRGHGMRGALLALAGGGLLGLGGWLGGHLAYSQGVGVDTGNFEQRAERNASHAPPGHVVVEPSSS